MKRKKRQRLEAEAARAGLEQAREARRWLPGFEDLDAFMDRVVGEPPRGVRRLPRSRFTLTLSLGETGMCSAADIAWALQGVADGLEGATEEEHWHGEVYSTTGVKVGVWGFAP